MAKEKKELKKVSKQEQKRLAAHKEAIINNQKNSARVEAVRRLDGVVGQVSLSRKDHIQLNNDIQLLFVSIADLAAYESGTKEETQEEG